MWRQGTGSADWPFTGPEASRVVAQAAKAAQQFDELTELFQTTSGLGVEEGERVVHDGQIRLELCEEADALPRDVA